VFAPCSLSTATLSVAWFHRLWPDLIGRYDRDAPTVWPASHVVSRRGKRTLRSAAGLISPA
ncbi:MAG: hypothetical protein M3Y74_03795, partial [Chloroflexota bacterium]|nr:hypothetical protein [Chloroflexota bacterium]